MKRYLYIFALLLSSFHCMAQNPSLEQKYYYTCKIWGFAKYYHSRVSNCQVNWDSVLLAALPNVRTASTSNQFNDALMTMLNAAGPMTLAFNYFPDTLPAELKRNRDFSWINTPVLRSDVQIILDTIKNNFRPHPICWVNVNPNEYIYPPPSTSWTGHLEFPYDSVALDVNTTNNYPDPDHRLLMFFKYWNIVEYFNPYNYVLDIPWDTTLHNYAVDIANAQDAYSLYLLELKTAANLNDAHSYSLTWSTWWEHLPGGFLPKIRLKYLNGQYVVIKSSVQNVQIGDAVLTVDGRTMTQWEDSLRPYFSSGNDAVFKRSVCSNVLGRLYNNFAETLTVEDSDLQQHVVQIYCNTPNNDPFFNTLFYPADSLGSISWSTMPCDIGYVNLANLQQSDEYAMYSNLSNKPAIILDIRAGSPYAQDVANLMYPTTTLFAKLSYPDVTYPGTYYWYYANVGVQNNPAPYTGRVILLMNEVTQSSSEYSCMRFLQLPNVLKVGSHTAGADGNITQFSLSEDMRFGFSSLGVYYPNNDSTQRIGIVPDSIVYPSRAGIRDGRDEVLEKALEVAGCDLHANIQEKKEPKIIIYPNPTKDLVRITANGINGQHADIEVRDVTGRLLMTQRALVSRQGMNWSLNVAELVSGIYFVKIVTSDGFYEGKFVKQ